MKYKVVNKKLLLVGLLLLLSLGYALLSGNLTINGNSKLANSTWDIHFDNVISKEGRVSVGENESEAVINPNDNTEVTYNVTLSKPGDFYEFNVDIVNAGSIDGQIERINSRLKIGDDEAFVITDNPSNLPPYLTYSITYADDSEIIPNHLLKSGNSETIKVRVEFKRDIDSSILPEDDIDLTLTIQPDLIQKNDDAIEDEEENNTPIVNNCTYDGELVQGAEYTNGQYTYRYMQEYVPFDWQNIESDGWGVTLTNKDSTDPVTSNLCTTINDKPIVSMQLMFAGSQTSSINTRFDTSSVSNMLGMFGECSNLKELDLSSFDTRNVTNMDYMLFETYGLEKLKLPANFIPNGDISVDLEGSFFDYDENEIQSLTESNNYDSIVSLQRKYSLTIGYEEMVETTTHSGLYNPGSNITLRAKEQDGLVFEEWSTGESTKEITFIINEDTTIYPIYSFNNVAIFDSGSTINQIMRGAIQVPGNNTYSLKHFERSDTLIQDIESIVSNMNIEVTEEEIDDYISYDFGVDRDYARLRVIHNKKGQLLGDYLISSYDSGYDIYGWFSEEDETYYYYTDTDDIFLNNNSSYFFANLQDLIDYNGLKEVNTYFTFDMSGMFYGCSSITHLDLGSFNLSNIYVIDDFLTDASSIKKITTPKVLFNERNIRMVLNNVFLDNQDNTYVVIDSDTPARIVLTLEESAMFDVGLSVNYKLKMLAGDSEIEIDSGNVVSPSVEQTIVSGSYYRPSTYSGIVDKKIEKVIRANNLPNGFEEGENNTISASKSYYPIYAWYDENEKTIYYYTEADKIYFNFDSSYMFCEMSVLTDISGLANVDFSAVKYIFEMFSKCSLLETIDMSNWDFSSIEYIDNYNESISYPGVDMSMAPNPMVSQDTFGSGENNVDSSTYSMFLDDYYLQTIITPKKMFTDSRIKISLDGKYEDSNHNNYYVLNKDTPSKVQFSSLYRTVAFDSNGGNISEEYIRVLKGENINHFPEAQNNELILVGWYTLLEGGILVDENYIVEDNIKLFARWRNCENVQIVFDKNDDNAVGSMENQTVLEKNLSYLNLNEYTLDNHIFIGWNTERDGTGYSYEDGDEVNIIGNLTLYAQWIRTYTITFDKNDDNAVGDQFTQTLVSGVSTPIDDNAFSAYTLTGNIIDNYNTEVNNTGVGYYQTQSITIYQDTVLYAQWENSHLLYSVLKKEARTGELAKEYTGNHGDSMDSSKSTEKIYHWYTGDSNQITQMQANQIIDKNNVIFAGQCWQMIRTTDTGGVKMIYNGEAENNQCLNTRGKHEGYSEYLVENLNDNYWYGTDYTYDKTTAKFSIEGEVQQSTWSENNSSGLIGKYTCKKTTRSDTCSTLYLIDSYYDGEKGNVISLDANSHYSQFGELPYNVDGSTPGDVGYMKGDKYYSSYIASIDHENYKSSFNLLLYYNPFYSSDFYSKTVTFDGTNYILDNPILGSEIPEDSYTGYYTFGGGYVSSANGKTSGNTVRYIVGEYEGAYYSNAYTFLELSGGQQLNNHSIMIGDSITDNLDGTYTINNTSLISPDDWYVNYDNYIGKYTCGDSSISCSHPGYLTNTSKTSFEVIDAGEKIMIAKEENNYVLTDTLLVRKDELVKNPNDYGDYKYTCNTDSSTCTKEDIRLIVSISSSGYYYAPNRYYGKSVSWDGTNYTLNNTIDFEDYNDVDNLSAYHFVCLSTGTKTCSEVAYVYSSYSINSTYRIMNFIVLNNGVKTVDELFDNMFTKNTNNSTIKTGIDNWYKKYILPFDDRVEDTIFCNDRSISNYGGWNPNGGNVGRALTFKEFNTNSSLDCENITDKFSVSNSSARLTYKVGLLSSPELKNLNNAIIRKSGQEYWIGTPYYFSDGSVNYAIDDYGSAKYSSVVESKGVRPVISLKSGILYTSGDGSMVNPYVVD